MNLQMTTGQVIKINLNNELDKLQLLLEHLDDAAALICFQRDTRMLVVASCPPTLDVNNLVYVLAFAGAAAGKDQLTNCDIWIASGKNCPAALKGSLSKHPLLDGVKCTRIENCHSLFIKEVEHAQLAVQDASPALDFVPLAKADHIPGLISCEIITDGHEMKDYARSFFSESFNDEGANRSREEDFEAHAVDDEFAELERMLKQLSTPVAPPSKQLQGTPTQATQQPSNAQATAFSARTANLIARMSMQMACPPIYSMSTWKMSVVSLANGARFKLIFTTGAKEAAIVICNQATKTLAVSFFGNESTSEIDSITDSAVRKCVLALLAGKDASKQHLVYKIIAPESGTVATALRKAITNEAGIAGQQLIFSELEMKVPPTVPKQQYCTYYTAFMEMREGLGFRIVDGSKPEALPPSYALEPTALSEAAGKRLLALHQQGLAKASHLDVIEVHDFPLNIVLTPDLVLDVNLSSMQCCIQLLEKHIVMVRLSEAAGKVAVLQLSSEDFEKCVTSDPMTQGHFMILTAFCNLPENKSAPPSTVMVVFKKGAIGHAKDQTLCDKYAKNFKEKYYDRAFPGLKSVFTKRAGKNFELHPLDTEIERYTAEPGVFLCFRLENNSIKIETRTALPSTFGLPNIHPPGDATAHFSFYKTLGITTTKSIKTMAPWKPDPNAASVGKSKK